MRFLPPAKDNGPRTTDRSGFTLIELLVVVGILLLVSLTTVMLINSTLDSDRTRSAARQFQSVLAGARDRALHARAVRGVRLYREPSLGVDGRPGRAGIDDNQNNTVDDQAEIGWIGSDDNNLVTKMVYIGETDSWRQGVIQVGRFDFDYDGQADSPDVRVVRGSGTGWKRLYDRGLLITGSRIKIPGDDTGVWYTVDTAMLREGNYVRGRPETLILTTDYLVSPPVIGYQSVAPDNNGAPGLPNFNDNGINGNDDDLENWWPGSDDVTDIHAFPALFPVSGQGNYILELEPSVLPNQEPIELPRNIVIDLMLTSNSSPTYPLNQTRRIPPALLVRPDRIDILFSPRGTVTGPASAAGIIHFLIRDIEDVTKFSEDPISSEREQLVLTIFTQTGNVTSNPVGPNYAQFWDYAERGEVAGQ